MEVYGRLSLGTENQRQQLIKRLFVQSRSGRFGEGNSPVSVQGIEQRIFSWPVRSQVTIPTELSELL
jgi:hypothetical protein